MASSKPKLVLSRFQDIPFNKLVLSQSNVRRVKVGLSIEQLAEDIAHRGLLQSLNVRPILDAQGVETGMFEIPAGGRRYRALETLVKQKRMTKTTPVPCVLRERGDTTAEGAWDWKTAYDAGEAATVVVTPLARFRQGTPIPLDQGVLFTTYATLRTDARDERVSRVRQIVDWLGSGFDGVIVFDESHAMANAAGGKSERGDSAPSQQGRAGLRLQHALPNARIVYVSATGATTVHNLAYAQRLGLWGSEDFPFATRAEFVEAIEAGGVAAMEVLARDLKSLGLYAARSLSYEGVEYELVVHTLTPVQIRIYDAFAGAFEIIHKNLDPAMQAANVTGEHGTLNAQAKSAARSAFESAKQRFSSHLITSMKTATLIKAIETCEKELTDVPTFTDSDLHIVTGLLLPIWKRLPEASMRVYRLQSDAGERIIGRLVTPAWAQAVSANGVTLAPADARTAVLDGRTVLELQDGLQLRRAKVMGAFRVELTGFTDGMVDRLKAMGLVSEIIAWKLRLFVPTGANGSAILGALMERYPLARIADRAAA